MEIKLNGNHVALIDDDCAWVLEGPKWQLSKSGAGKFYVKRMIKKDKKITRQYLHRLLCGNPEGMVVDHINRNTLDNRKSNLRVVTTQQNSWNRVGTTNGFKGVAKHKYGYCSQIMVNGKHIYCGFFKSKIDAARRYDEVAKQHYGEFALTNERLGKFDTHAA
jgi:hypothetical protein